jgi:hypothetical protein
LTLQTEVKVAESSSTPSTTDFNIYCSRVVVIHQYLRK